MTEPRERPILFSGPMVRAILDGRKTQTRRVVKADGIEEAVSGHFYPSIGCAQFRREDGRESLPLPCPYGRPGDRLWVRETLQRQDGGAWVYGADLAPVTLPHNHPSVLAMVSWAHHKESDTCVSIHMPRWASRLTLEVVGVRVERLHNISEADARAEGVGPSGLGTWLPPGEHHPEESSGTPQACFRRLWSSINGTESWDSNPWVWVVEFRRVEGTP